MHPTNTQTTSTDIEKKDVTKPTEQPSVESKPFVPSASCPLAVDFETTLQQIYGRPKSCR